MGHDHNHSHAGKFMRLSIGLTAIFVILEGVSGYLAHSLSLLSDAGHNFADLLALLLSWYALNVSMRPADAKRTYGYHRAGILAALVNAVCLVVISFFIFFEAWHRLESPVAVHGSLVIVIALVAMILNGFISLILKKEAEHDLNIRGAYIHMLGDALSAIGVVIAGVFILLTGDSIADPLVSILIGIFILWSSWGILASAVNILLEAAPQGFDVPRLKEAIENIHGIQEVHDLHVWTVTSEMNACSCHVTIANQSVEESQTIRRAIEEMMKRDFSIQHTTIQLEVEGCKQCVILSKHLRHG